MFVRAAVPAASSFPCLSVGISNNNIRLDLKEMLDKGEATDYELMKAINEAVHREKERNLRQQAVISNAVEAAEYVEPLSIKPPTPAETKTLEIKKKRENLMQVEMKELRAKSDKHEAEMKAMREQNARQHAEIMAMLASQAANTQGGFLPQHPPPPLPPQPPQQKRRPVYKCKNCQDNNVYRCEHCFKCGNAGHRVFECPEN